MHVHPLIFFSVFLLWGLSVAADSRPYPERPAESAVYDDNHLMNANEIELFNVLSDELRQKTGIDLACVLLNDIGHQSNEHYAKATAEQWNPGEKDGLLIFVAQKQRWKDVVVIGAIQKIYDQKTLAKLQQKNLLPAFREYNYSQGILALAYALAEKGAKSKGVKLNVDKKQYELQQNNISSLMILFIMFVVFFLLMAKFSGGRGNGCLWFLFGGAIKERKKKDEDIGFAGNFGSTRGGFGGGFGGSFDGGFRGKL